MLFHELFKLHSRLHELFVLFRVRANGVARHGNLHNNALGVHAGVNFLESFSCNRGLVVIRLLRVLKSEKALSHGVTERNFTAVNECDFLGVAPSQEIPTDLAAEGASSEKQA